MNGLCSRGGAAFRGDALIGRGATVIVLPPCDSPASLPRGVLGPTITWSSLSSSRVSIGYLAVLFTLSVSFLVASALVKPFLNALLCCLISLYYFGFSTFSGRYLGIRLSFFRLSIYTSSALQVFINQLLNYTFISPISPFFILITICFKFDISLFL